MGQDCRWRQGRLVDLISHVYPMQATAQAFGDWDASPGEFAKILIDVKG